MVNFPVTPERTRGRFHTLFSQRLISLLPSPNDAVLSFGPTDTLLTPA